MLRFIKRLFAWWDGVTIGTAWTLLSRGARFIGADEYGNRYFEERRTSLEGRKRRYVTYNGYADASRVPPDWHGWLHHTVAEPPSLDLVGEDGLGNRYFEEVRTSVDDVRRRRFVAFADGAEVATVPDDWRAWLDRTAPGAPDSAAPTKSRVRGLPRRSWELDHRPNLTGTLHAWRPQGSLARSEGRAKQTGDYEAWTPGD